MRLTDFESGWAVVGNDGRRVGSVKGVTRNYVLTSRPGFAADLYIPATYIAMVEHETIHLNITHKDVDQMGWEQPPRDDAPGSDDESDLHRHV